MGIRVESIDDRCIQRGNACMDNTHINNFIDLLEDVEVSRLVLCSHAACSQMGLCSVYGDGDTK